VIPTGERHLSSILAGLGTTVIIFGGKIDQKQESGNIQRSMNVSEQGQRGRLQDLKAIDFQALYREEKRKARENQQQQQRHEQQSNTPPPPETASSGESLSSSSVVKIQQEVAINTQFPLWERKVPLKINHFLQKKDCISFQDPGIIFYKSRYLDDADFTERLLDWLEQLPENNKNTTTATCHSNDDDDEEEERSANGKWTRLIHARRRVALFDRRIAPFPEPLQQIIRAMVHSNVFSDAEPPNHILINEYSFDQGIMPHTDGPAYMDRTATISLGGSVILHFTSIHREHPLPSHHHHKPHLHRPCSVLLEGNGSLIVFEADAYSQYQHSIRESPNTDVEYVEDHCLNAATGTAVRRSHRYSITIRRKK
jgi:alkylated DNA repair protein alkB family protein 6